MPSRQLRQSLDSAQPGAGRARRARHQPLRPVVAVSVAQTGSLFSADAWNNITFTGEVKDPRRNIHCHWRSARSSSSPVSAGQHGVSRGAAPRRSERTRRPCGNGHIERITPGPVAAIAVTIMISTFGHQRPRVGRRGACDGEGQTVLHGGGPAQRRRCPPRVWYKVWAILRAAARRREHQDLRKRLRESADYVISANLIFYILTISPSSGCTRPNAGRPYKAFGYPVVPALYILGAAAILLVLFVYRPATTWPGLMIMFLGLPVYYFWKTRKKN